MTCFCQRNSDNPFADGSTHFGKIFFHFQDGGMGWLTRPRNDTFDLEHGSPGCHRPEAKEAVRRPTTKKCGSPLTEPLNWENRPGSGLPPFLFPILKDIVQCCIQCGFQPLFHDSENLSL